MRNEYNWVNIDMLPPGQTIVRFALSNGKAFSDLRLTKRQDGAVFFHGIHMEYIEPIMTNPLPPPPAPDPEWDKRYPQRDEASMEDFTDYGMYGDLMQ